MVAEAVDDAVDVVVELAAVMTTCQLEALEDILPSSNITNKTLQ